MCVELRRAKFQPSNAKGTFQIGVWIEGRKNLLFQPKTSHISETVRDMAKVTI